jgi:hypothetical protein
MARKSSSSQKQSNGGTLGFEAKLWQAADKYKQRPCELIDLIGSHRTGRP